MSINPVPPNKKQYITDIGKNLVKENGKKKYYTPKEVKKAHKHSNWFDIIDFSCWAMSIFSSHEDFDDYHEERGEVCDYVKMKTEMLSELSKSSNTRLMDISDVDIDTSWLDLGGAFDGILEGIGDFISAVFEGLSDL